MTDFPIVSRGTRADHVDMVLDYYSNAALTTGNQKIEWVVPFYYRILDVIVDSETAGLTGGTSDIMDVNINGTTVYTTQSNRPTLLLSDTGMWTEAAEPEVQTGSPGDIISLDVDQICTTGSARVKVAILLGMR